MKKISLIFILVILGGVIIFSQDTIKFKMMTYNIRHGYGIDKVFNFQRVIDTIKEENPDLLILNEVDMGNPRSLGQKQAKMVADELKMEYYFYATEGRKDYGNAVLSKYPILEATGFDLPQPRWMSAVQRGCSAAIIDLEGTEILLMGEHLGLGGVQEVETELNEVYEFYKKNKLPTITGGDYNVEWSELRYSAKDLLKEFSSVNHVLDKELNTIPADNPGPQIDYILVTKEFKVVDVYTVDSYASDHLPVVAILEMKK